MSNVLDLLPRLRSKKTANCKHLRVSVDMDVASLTCDDCCSEIDPWSYIRQLCSDDEDQETYASAQRAAHQKWAEEAHEKEKIMAAKVNELIAEVNRLNKIKNELQNEQVNGRSLYMHAKVRRSRSKRPT